MKKKCMGLISSAFNGKFKNNWSTSECKYTSLRTVSFSLKVGWHIWIKSHSKLVQFPILSHSRDYTLHRILTSLLISELHDSVSFYTTDLSTLLLKNINANWLFPETIILFNSETFLLKNYICISAWTEIKQLHSLQIKVIKSVKKCHAFKILKGTLPLQEILPMDPILSQFNSDITFHTLFLWDSVFHYHVASSLKVS